MRHKTGLSGYLVGLCAALVIPVLVFAVVVGVRFVASERARLEGRAHELARSVRTSIEQDIAGLTAITESLASNHALVEEDFDRFDLRAREIARRVGVNIVVRDLDGQQVVNTRVPRGAALPRVNQPENDDEAVRTRRAIVTGVFTGAVAQTELVMVLAPVVRNDAVVALINLSLPTERILTTIQAERPVPEWSIFVVDASNRIIAHTEDHASLTGSPFEAELFQATQTSGSYAGRSHAGEDVFVAFQRSPRTGWLVGVQVPRSIIEQPLRQSLAVLLLLGIGLAIISAAATFGLASILRRSVQQVSDAATRMGRGLLVEPPVTAVTEADLVGRALSDASYALHERSDKLRRSETRLRHVLDNLYTFVAVLETDGTLIEVNRAPLQAAGLSRADVVGKLFWDCYWWSFSPEAQARLENAAARATDGETARYDAEIRVADAAIMIIDFQIAPLHDPNGAVISLIASAVDITARKRGEEQNARLAAIVSSTSDAIISFSLDDQTVQTWNKGAEALFGFTQAEAIGMSILRLVPPKRALPIENERGLFDTIMAEGQVRVDTVRQRKDGSLVDVSASGTKIVDDAGSVIGVSAIFRDISERKRAEEQQKLLIRELHHRIKNTLATVQAIAGATMRSAQSMTAFRDLFAARLSALAETHTLLTENAWAGASLRELLDAQLASFAENGSRIALSGPDLRLPAETLVALGMVVHELATNAVKHGALSVPRGRIAIDWTIAPEQSGQTFTLHWKEMGGPPVVKPTRTGFGTLLLERVIGPKLNGEVTVEHAASGVQVTIIAALPSTAEVDEAIAAG